MGSLFAVLYHLGVMQRVVDVLAAALARTLGTSGAESLAAVANVFLGMTESALVVRPYLERMTRSELFCLMTVGMSTVAGSVMVAYAAMLGGGDYAGHLATASLLSAPAGILVAKLMVPETRGARDALRAASAVVERTAVNVIDAAARGRDRRPAARRLRRRAAGRLRRADRAGERRLRLRRRLVRRAGSHAPARARLRARAARAR